MLKSMGDRSMIAYFPDEASALAFATQLRTAGFAWLEDVVPAYASVGVFFDPEQIRSADVRSILSNMTTTAIELPSSRGHIIPCCYELGPDLQRVAEHVHLPVEDVIRLHTASEYRVYAIGFCPGFPYLGYLPPELTGVPRLHSPRVRVEPGSVGLTARQTGLYPLARPGGWNLIGRTPLTIVDVEEGYFPIRVGDMVRFRRINESEFQQQLGLQLENK